MPSLTPLCRPGLKSLLRSPLVCPLGGPHCTMGWLCGDWGSGQRGISRAVCVAACPPDATRSTSSLGFKATRAGCQSHGLVMLWGWVLLGVDPAWQNPQLQPAPGAALCAARQ